MEDGKLGLFDDPDGEFEDEAIDFVDDPVTDPEVKSLDSEEINIIDKSDESDENIDFEDNER